jgi:NtrC-family two-component system response regulator AlgB
MLRALQEGVVPGSQSSALRVLVVDDERNIRKMLSVCLQAMGCAVTEAATSRAALEAVHLMAPDVAIVDLRLGTESGLDLLRTMLAARPALDVVVITAYATAASETDANRLGARAYLAKPFTPAEIRDVLARIQARRESELHAPGG